MLAQNLKCGNLAENQSSLRLHEIGPRITMRLMKIEDDLMTGEVLYHDYIEKDAIEVEALRKKRAQQRRLKEQRKHKQEENLKKKENDKKEHRAKTSKQGKSGEITEQDKLLLKDAEEAVGDISDEDDREYYRKEIGDNPDEELFESAGSGNRKRPFIPKGSNYSLKPKKPRMDKRKQYEEDDRLARQDGKRRGNEGKDKKGKAGKFAKKGMGDDFRGKSKYNGGKKNNTGGKKSGGKKSSKRK